MTHIILSIAQNNFQKSRNSNRGERRGQELRRFLYLNLVGPGHGSRRLHQVKLRNQKKLKLWKVDWPKVQINRHIPNWNWEPCRFQKKKIQYHWRPKIPKISETGEKVAEPRASTTPLSEKIPAVGIRSEKASIFRELATNVEISPPGIWVFSQFAARRPKVAKNMLKITDQIQAEPKKIVEKISEAVEDFFRVGLGFSFRDWAR